MLRFFCILDSEILENLRWEGTNIRLGRHVYTSPSNRSHLYITRNHPNTSDGLSRTRIARCGNAKYVTSTYAARSAYELHINKSALSRYSTQARYHGLSSVQHQSQGSPLTARCRRLVPTSFSYGSFRLPEVCCSGSLMSHSSRTLGTPEIFKPNAYGATLCWFLILHSAF